MTFDPNEQRDGRGRWTTGGLGDTPEVVERHLLDPRVLDVSGDEWNKKTAERLEKEYAAVRPEINAIAEEGVAKGASAPAPVHDDEDEVEPIDSWDSLSGSQQEEAQQHYHDSHLDTEKDFAVSSWQDNGGGLYEAKHDLAQDDDFKSEWLSEFLKDREEEGAPPIPFKAGDLLGAINIRPGDEGDDDPEITFDEKYLDSPTNIPGKDQLTLPGIEPQNPPDFLTAAMRDEIEKSLIEKFNDDAKSKAENMDPPEYLNEEAETNVNDAWDNMDEDEKLQYAKDNVDSVKEMEENGVSAPTGEHLSWPSKFDPLNTTSGMDYRRTQALAKYIADRRGAQLITQRAEAGLIGRAGYGGPNSPGVDKAAWTARMMGELQRADFKLWSGWKGSSTNDDGRLLQVAASDELGGRIREAKPEARYFGGATNIAESKLVAKDAAANAATPEAKAAAQKWLDENKFSVDEIRSVPELKSEKVGNFTRLPDVKIEKNGAASTSVSADVANNWNGTTNNAPQGINKKESIEYANKTYAAIGGYEGVKAALRAKWETTQYLLDKADIPIVQAYRGINLAHKIGVSETGEFNAPSSGIVHTKDGGEFDLSKAPVGAVTQIASGKIITKKSSGFSSDVVPPGPGTWTYQEPEEAKQRIVLRAEVPRTAVVSVPAYGVNVKSEQEVVVVGTAWRGWEAWSGRAPTFEEVPLHAKAAQPSALDQQLAEFSKKTKEMAAT